MGERTMPHRTSSMVTWLLPIAALLVSACSSGSVASAISQPQTDAEIGRVMGGLQPTERFVTNADAKLLWQATSGYMDKAFPLDELSPQAQQGNPRQLRTKLVEW